MSGIFDSPQVRRAFGRAATSYAQASAVQREIESRLLESLPHYAMRHAGAQPQMMLDVGCGPATGAHTLREAWPKAQIVAVDAALPMLHAARTNTHGQWLRRKEIQRVCADLRALPFATASVDLIFCNLALQWVDDLPAAFAQFRRVLRPGGMLLCATFGPATLHELHHAFAQVDDAPHVSPFADIARFGDALVAASFEAPVLDRDVLVEEKTSFRDVLMSLRAMGATNALQARRRTLSARTRFTQAEAAYMRNHSGAFPMTWEAIYAQAWAPPPGTPIREGAAELTSIPVNAIPIRRR